MHAGHPASRGVLAERCYASAYRALEAGELSNARRLFGLLTLLEPRQERSWIGLSVSQERSGRQHAAAALYTLGSRAVGGDSAWLALGRARCLRALGRQHDAEQAFAAAEAATNDPTVLSAIQEEQCR